MNNQPKIELFEKLNKFVKRFYTNQLIKGGIYSIAVLTIFFLLFGTIEHFTQFGVGSRTFLFWTYLIINTSIAIKYIVIPLLHLLSFGKTLSHKQAAKIIGTHFTEVDDKLLNILELQEMSKADNALINASIQQKIKDIKPISFGNAINYSDNKKHAKWVLVPLTIILLFIISGKQYILTESSARILKHNTFFEPKAPFQYLVLNPKLEVIQYEDYTLEIEIVGNEIPSEVFIKIDGNSFRIKSNSNTTFEHLFKGVNADISFQFLAGGYHSNYYTLKALPQPKVVDLNAFLNYPNYTKIKNEVIKNNGDLIIPEGTIVQWDASLQNTKNISLIFSKSKHQQSTNNSFTYKRAFFSSTPYQIITQNEHQLSDSLSYYIKVIPDASPLIKVSQNFDSTNAQFLFSGEIEDDYLLRKLTFNYRITSNDTNPLVSQQLTIKQLSKELFFFTFKFNELNLAAGEEIEYYFEVWDNDGVNGSKNTKSTRFLHKEATKEDLIAKKDAENEKTKSGLNKSISLAKEIKKDIAELNKSILEKKKISWEEKQKAKEILKKQKQLEQQIKDTQKKNSENLKNKEKLNSSILEKQKQLEELMNKVLDEETKKLLQEMEDMMDKADKEKLKDLLEKLDDENTDLEKELDRELELFKQLEFEQKVEETLEKISALKKEQEDLKKETEQGKSEKEELAKKQEELSKKMEDLQKDLQDLRKKNMALEDKNKMPDTKANEEDVKQKMQESKEALQKGKKKKAKKAQEDALEELEELEQQLQSMQQSSGEDKPKEDMETLRKILENLVTLSFDQEKLMQHAKSTPRNSAEFIKIVQRQNKLADNSQIIEDSLLALSKRVVQIQATINREITAINKNMNKATKELEGRQIEKAAERQQFVMTSTNNLALLLSEILEQMQKDLEMPPSNCNKPKNCNKPNPNCKKPSMSQLKEAQKKLNKEMKKGKSGKKGKKKGEKNAKKLMQLAKKQEAIRKQLMELRDEQGKNGEKGKLDKILEDMQENETDIINNRITQETIARQEEILTRLLEAEKAEREQDEDDKRKSTEWNFIPDNTTEQYLEYKKQKQQQEELLKTTPVQLKPYYKKKVNTYFNTLIKENK
ncbi:MAG: hypothetical protein ACI84S_000377 [Thalassomonas sp.]|jgi:hypothetical protein